VRRRIDRYAREIVPSFNAYLYFRVGYWLAKSVARLLYRVRLGYADEAGLAQVDPKSTVVFVMNHRSNMDYVLVAFLAAEQVALSYAVGEWARVWPLQALIRSMGAFFVRRNSGDPLYRTVLARYVAMATEAGVPQALFPEGGLTVDGAPAPAALRPARLHGEVLPRRWRARPGVHPGRPQLRPRAGGPQPAAQAGGAQRRRRGMLSAVSVTLTFVRAQPVADAHRQLAPLRLCLREFRQPGVDAAVRARSAAWISLRSTRTPASARWRNWAAT
jgi:1-acyl-sn-glycerol-3-phosphate acyltransferase